MRLSFSYSSSDCEQKAKFVVIVSRDSLPFYQFMYSEIPFYCKLNRCGINLETFCVLQVQFHNNYWWVLEQMMWWKVSSNLPTSKTCSHWPPPPHSSTQNQNPSGTLWTSGPTLTWPTFKTLLKTQLFQIVNVFKHPCFLWCILQMFF